MDELVEKVREALAAEYPGAPNGRVRDVPDRRAIRWYTTIGLVDKPLGMRGRTALYGPRHLQQLVAIKRRQAAGASLADIQVEFTWLTPQGLDEIARVPGGLLTNESGLSPDSSTRDGRFWAEAPAAAAPVTATPAEPDPPLGFHRGRTGPGNGLSAREISAVPLDGGVIVLVPRILTDRDRDEIAVAAAPLLALLTARGLTDGSSS
jgi:hypothetical protein